MRALAVLPTAVVALALCSLPVPAYGQDTQPWSSPGTRCKSKTDSPRPRDRVEPPPAFAVIPTILQQLNSAGWPSFRDHSVTAPMFA
jgi:hypothetical protein